MDWPWIIRAATYYGAQTRTVGTITSASMRTASVIYSDGRLSAHNGSQADRTSIQRSQCIPGSLGTTATRTRRQRYQGQTKHRRMRPPSLPESFVRDRPQLWRKWGVGPGLVITRNKVVCRNFLLPVQIHRIIASQ